MRISDWSSDVCSSDLVRDPLTHFPEMRGRDLAHVGAAAFADNRESEQRAHLLQGESQLPRAAHEAEASHVLPRITAIAAPALRYRQQSDPLIIPDRLEIAADRKSVV